MGRGRALGKSRCSTFLRALNVTANMGARSPRRYGQREIGRNRTRTLLQGLPMKRSEPEMSEGEAAFHRFREAVKSVLRVRKSDLPPKPQRGKKKATKR